MMVSRSKRGHLRLAFVSLLTTLAVGFAANSAFANPPNESGTWNQEITNISAIQSPDAAAEAYNADGLLQVWRGNDNHIYTSYNHGEAQRIGSDTMGVTNTVAAPRVIPFGTNGWAIFHTGIDGRIYWWTIPNGQYFNRSTSSDTGIIYPLWNAVPNSTTDPTLSPAVAQVNPAQGIGDTSFLLTYRAATGTQLWSQWFNGNTGWDNPLQVPDGQSPSTPGLTWNQGVGSFLIYFRGTDNRLYSAFQVLGGPWSQPALITAAVNIASGPSVGALSNGDMQIAMRDADGHIWYMQYYMVSGYDGPTRENTNVVTNSPPQISSQQQNQMWTLAAIAGIVYWKLSMRENSLS